MRSLAYFCGSTNNNTLAPSTIGSNKSRFTKCNVSVPLGFNQL